MRGSWEQKRSEPETPNLFHYSIILSLLRIGRCFRWFSISERCFLGVALIFVVDW